MRSGEFPELHGVSVGAAVSDLTAFGIPELVVAEWAGRFAGGLNALQLADSSRALQFLPRHASARFRCNTFRIAQKALKILGRSLE